MTATKPKILVIRGGAIGDFILTLPAITALRRRFQVAHLEVLGYPHIAQLALAGGLVDRVQPIEAGPLAGFFARDGQLASHWTDYFSEFDLIVSYLFDPDEIFQTNVARCSPAQFVVGPHRPDETEKVHATKVYLRPLERLAIFDADAVPRLRVGLSLTASPGGTGQLETGETPVLRTLAVHPGSGSERKNWPETKWAELLQRFSDSTDLDLLLVGGEAEGERLQRLAATLPSARVKVAQSLPLAELARLLQGCAAFVGHDSGISHLAAALGLPGLVLWGDTVEEIWRPPHEAFIVVKSGGGLKMISVEQVVKEMASLLKARNR